MDNLYYITYLYLAIVFAAFLSSMLSFAQLDRASKIVSFFLLETLIAETLATYSALRWHNNLPVYSIQSIVELTLISLYFNYSIDVFKKNKIGFVIALIGILIGCLNILILQPLNAHNTYFILFEGVMIISMALFYFFRIFITTEKIILSNNPHFWFAVVFLLWWNLTFLNWGLLDYYMAQVKEKVWVIYLSIMLVNIFMYAALGLIFFIYPKLKLTNE